MIEFEKISKSAL